MTEQERQERSVANCAHIRGLLAAREPEFARQLGIAEDTIGFQLTEAAIRARMSWLAGASITAQPS